MVGKGPYYYPSKLVVAIFQPIALLHLSVYEPHTTNNCCICSDEEANVRNVSFKTLYGGQFVLSTQLIKPNYLNCGELPVCKDGLNWKKRKSQLVGIDWIRWISELRISLTAPAFFQGTAPNAQTNGREREAVWDNRLDCLCEYCRIWTFYLTPRRTLWRIFFSKPSAAIKENFFILEKKFRCFRLSRMLLYFG